MKISTDRKLIEEALTRSVDRIYPTKEALEKELRSGRRLRIYLGTDPTGPHLHLGHATNLLTLRRLQKLGHEIILLVGDFTARIGDPTDKMAARQPLTEKQIRENMKTFKAQAAKVLSFGPFGGARLVFNSKWHAKMTFEKLIGLASHFTEQQMVERDMFQERKRNDKPIGLHEFLYPLMQGYDSVALDVDLEIGGTDQTFNMLAGRKLLRECNNKEKFVLTTKLLVDPTTNKKIMNKSEGGLVNLDDEPSDMFGKVMALPDTAIVPIAEFSTEMPMDEVHALSLERNPRDAKLKTAFAVVKTYHGETAAEKARATWIRTFSEKERPENAPKLKMKNKTLAGIDLLLAAGIESKSEARRLLEQGAVKINDGTVSDGTAPVTVKSGDMLRIGKHRFFEIE